MENKETKKCEHIWLGVGLWDGVTPEGQKTGGIMFQCKKCGERATNEQKIKELGGTINWEESAYKSADRPKS